MSSTPLRFAWSASRTSSPAEAGRAAPASEIELVRRAAEGDLDGQAWLVARVVGPVRAVARAILGSPPDADDAAQKALLEILGGARTYCGDGTVEAWARRIAVRTALRHARRERRQPTATSATDVIDDLVAPAADSTLDALPRPVGEYLDELPEPQRHALLLHHALGYTVAEVAELTESGAETVRSRLRLGIAALRKRVRQELLLGARKGDS